MALKSGLVLNCYTLPTTQSGQQPVTVPYADEVDALSFTTVMPGGFGQLTATIRQNVTDARLPQPQLAMFAHVALMDGPVCIFRGEILDSIYVIDTTVGDAYQITALGIGNQLRDDPYDATYNNKTAQFICNAELVAHGSTFHGMPQISQDISQIFPDNPAGTSSPAYDGRTMEEIVADQAILAGAYDWAVWDHPTQKDGAGFPLGQVSVLLHDPNTTHYQATLADREIVQAQIDISAERAYNYIEIWYNSQNGLGVPRNKVAFDSRLVAGTYDQGTAPFRKRKYRRDLSGTTTVGATQAQSVANAFLLQMENPTNKISMTLQSVRDAQGNPLDLWRVRSGKNLFVPDLAVRGQQLALTAAATVNQFFIVSSTYTETTRGATLTLELDNYVDLGERQVARLQLAADQKSRGAKFASLIQMLGAPVVGGCGWRFLATAGGQNGGGTVTYPTALYTTPTSVTTSFDVVVNATGATVSNITCYRFVVGFQSVAAGDSQISGTYTTVGNTIRRIDTRRRTLDWHCSGCDTLHEGLSTEQHVIVRHTHPSGVFVPGHTGLAIQCKDCGMVEHFNTALTADDEDVTQYGAHHAEHAVMIRKLMKHVKLLSAGADGATRRTSTSDGADHGSS